MSAGNKGIVTAIEVPFEYLGGVFQSLIDILVGLVMVPIRMFEALFDTSTS